MERGEGGGGGWLLFGTEELKSMEIEDQNSKKYIPHLKKIKIKFLLVILGQK